MAKVVLLRAVSSQARRRVSERREEKEEREDSEEDMLVLREAGWLLSEESRNLETGFIGLEDLLGVLEFLFWEP